MILNTCAACAKPIEHESSRCAGCQTRYCSERCERYDRRRGGHGKICGAIASGGGAEQYHADKKYEEAVAEAVEECADDTEGQTCYICLDGDAEEGLVRMCACRGAAGFAHVSCLAKQAKILWAEAEENLNINNIEERWRRWEECSLCEQKYHGVVACALGWACWKTYVGRPETDEARVDAMTILGNGLSEAEHYDDAVAVYEAELATEERLGVKEEGDILITRGNLAICYYNLGQLDEALSMQREVYAGRQSMGEYLLRAGNQDIAVCNLAEYLVAAREFEEAQSLAREELPAIIDRHGPDDPLTLEVQTWYALAFFRADGASEDDVAEALTILEDVLRRSRRVLGDSHPDTERAREFLEEVRSARADAAEES